MDGGHHAGYVTELRTTMQVRRRGVSLRLLSFIFATLVPMLCAASYLMCFASDQYVSDFRFSVRQAPASPMEGTSLAQGLAGGTSLLVAAMDAQIVVAYIGSHQMLDDLDGRIDLDSIYDTPRADWLARLDSSAPAEAKLRYWRRMVDAYFDISTGLVQVKVRSFSPLSAQQVAQEVLRRSETLVNHMSERARLDKVAFAEAQVQQRQARFAQAEVALADFRNTHGVLFPQLHATENSTLDAGLRQQLSQAQTQYQTLRDRGVSEWSPELRLLQTRATALQGQLDQVQSQLAGAPEGTDTAAPNLATTLSGYDQLDVADQIAQHDYERALTLAQQAESDAAQQQVYLEAFVQPNLPQDSLYPQRYRLLLEIFLASSALWALGALLFYGVREHLD